MKKKETRSQPLKKDLQKMLKEKTALLKYLERELVIEASLERVRKQAMRMYKPEDLLTICKALFTELQLLGFSEIWNALITVFNDEEAYFLDHDYSDFSGANLTRIPYDTHPIIEKFLKQVRKSQDAFAEIIVENDELNGWRTSRRRHGEPDDPRLENISALYYYFYSIGLGAIGISTFHSITKEKREVLKRFRNVFDLAYRRYTDITKAEAQAREAEIELALERVRARTMGMQKSEELKEVIKILYQQLRDLKINLDHAGFVVDYAPGGDWHFWIADEQDIPSKITHPYFESVWATQFNEAKDQGAHFFATHLNFEEKNKFYNELLSYIPALPKASKDFYLGCAALSGSTVLFDDVSLYMENFSGTPYSDEENNTLMRFGKVFQQTYTRFLDLQKAEAQAREAQIEAALERVRSRTMAMQKSEDLNEAASDMFKQIQVLGMQPWACGFNIFDKDEKTVTQYMSLADGGISPPFRTPLTEDPFFINIYKARKQKEELLVMESSGKSLAETYRYMFSLPGSREIFGDLEKSGFEMPKFQITHCAYFSQGYLVFITYGPVPEAHDIFKRFAKVFEQTYTRFLDLQKAEAQARESQIQLALERVRARTMAMQRSDELQDAAVLMFDQIESLGVSIMGCGFNIWDDNKKEATAWMSGLNRIQPPFTTSSSEDIFLRIYEAEMEGKLLFIEEQGGERLGAHYRYMASIPEFKKILENLASQGLSAPSYQVMHCAFFTQGYLMFISLKPIPEAHDIFKRFAKVFEQTYTRFLDLQKAEAQAREAQIEAALEKVRSRSLAMHKSDELKEVVQSVFDHLNELNIEFYTAIIVIFNEDSKDVFWWLVNRLHQQHSRMLIPYAELPYLHKLFEAKENGSDLFSATYSDREKTEFYNYLLEETDLINIPVEQKKFLLESEFATMSVALAKKTGIHITRYSEKCFTKQENEILKRFARVFDQAYVRFLDLQKAEAQAREAQIEAALERVRASAMAMHSSEGLLQVTQVLREQIALLGEKELESIIIHIYDEENDEFEAWYSYRHPEDKKGEIKIGRQNLDWSKTARARKDKEKYHGKDSDYTIVADRAMLKEWYEHLFEVVPLVVERDERGEILVPDVLYYNYSKISGGALLLITNSEASEYSKDLLKRAAKVFSLAYSRFLDLQKAEAQTREAQIETALERVRSRSLGMHKSDELQDVVRTVFDRLNELDVLMNAASIFIFREGSNDLEQWVALAGLQYSTCFHLSYFNLPMFRDLKEARQQGKETFVKKYSFDEKNTWFRFAFEHTDYRQLSKDRKKYLLESDCAVFAYGLTKNTGIQLANYEGEIFSETEIDILKRFAKVFEQAYVRFLDLQKAEIQAREAIKHASVDRIRAEIASMRTTSDLQRITPLIWSELTTLDVPFIRCGVFIMDDEQQLTHTFLSTPDGKGIAAFHIPYDTPGNIKNVLNHWKDRQNYIDHWDENAFTEFAHTLVDRGALASSEEYLKTVPQGGFYLHFLPFLQGMLYVGNATQLDKEEIELVQSVADAFSTAYARYEDFNRLEVAKKQVDTTLNELQVTQKQLIQSEKMASLGELTAGIAHEIQNPLNFVNNFSEVNRELIAELKEEVEKGNLSEIKIIAADIETNEEKINHHGKRADAIVKNMLQHSRSSSSKKEPTNINALADEYIRLSYHGMRAKDKLFNATIQTDFDETIGNINIIPQDIGRVLLNLYNNAFYATNEKQKLNIENYAPAVSVNTRRNGDKVEIKVADNGNGVPQNIVDKIFQPFFTTKPTGQGTGLGLSLSYDIIKAHGGEIKVETREGVGAEFILQLPLSKNE